MRIVLIRGGKASKAIQISIGLLLGLALIVFNNPVPNAVDFDIARGLSNKIEDTYGKDFVFSVSPRFRGIVLHLESGKPDDGKFDKMIKDYAKEYDVNISVIQHKYK